jgi:hypothetical protein
MYLKMNFAIKADLYRYGKRNATEGYINNTSNFVKRNYK